MKDDQTVFSSGQLFALGQIVATPGALALLEQEGADAISLLTRHVQGDFGEVPEEDERANHRAVRDGLRILSSYSLGGDAIWIITEADRSSTCLLLPSEY